MVNRKFLTRMQNTVFVEPNEDFTELLSDNGSILAVLKDIRISSNRGGASIGNYKLLDCIPLYTLNDEDEVFLVSEEIGLYDNNDQTTSIREKANLIFRNDEKLHDWLLETEKDYTLCFHNKKDHNGIFRVVLVYGIDKKTEKIVHVSKLPNIGDLNPYYLFFDEENSLGNDNSLFGWHEMINKGLNLISNPKYEEYKWISTDPTNKKNIIEQFFTEFFVTECDNCVKDVCKYIYDINFINTMESMRDNYRQLLADLVSVDMGIARLYSGNKPDNVIALETNNLFMKYNFGFMVNRRYFDIKYMKTLLIKSIKSMETEI